MNSKQTNVNNRLRLQQPTFPALDNIAGGGGSANAATATELESTSISISNANPASGRPNLYQPRGRGRKTQSPNYRTKSNGFFCIFPQCKAFEAIYTSTTLLQNHMDTSHAGELYPCPATSECGANGSKTHYKLIKHLMETKVHKERAEEYVAM